ncbi:MAG: hypothetical protein JXR07_19995 [Reichenbachiella sp.]
MVRYIAVICLLLASCKVKKNVVSNEEKTTSEVVEEVETLRVETQSDSSIHVELTWKEEEVEYQVEIIPKGDFIMLDGKFQGKAESVKIKSRQTTKEHTKDSVANKTSKTIKQDSIGSHTEKKSIAKKSKKLDRESTPAVGSYITVGFLFALLVIVYFLFRKFIL